MVRMVRYVLAEHPAFEDCRGRQVTDHLPHGFPLGWISLGKFELHSLVFLDVEPDHENALPDLGYAEVLRIKFPLENREARRFEQFLEVAEKFSVCLVPQSKDILEHKEI